MQAALDRRKAQLLEELKARSKEHSAKVKAFSAANDDSHQKIAKQFQTYQKLIGDRGMSKADRSKGLKDAKGKMDTLFGRMQRNKLKMVQTGLKADRRAFTAALKRSTVSGVLRSNIDTSIQTA